MTYDVLQNTYRGEHRGIIGWEARYADALRQK
jgi:hypothetical protein